MMGNRRGYAFYLVLALLAVLITTIALFGLMSQGFADMSGRVLVNLLAVILAELTTFGYAIFCVGTRDSDRSRFVSPFEFTAFGMLVLYDVSVTIVALLALTPISDAWLISLHIVVLLFIFLGMILMTMGSKAIASQEMVEHENRTAFFLLADEAKSLSEVARRLDNESWAETRAKLDELCEEFDYASGDSLPGGETADKQVTARLKNLYLLLQTCPVTATDEWVVQATMAIEALSVSVRNREQVMQRLRNRISAKAH